MREVFLAVVTATLLASGASAATLTLTSDKPTYEVGEFIILNVVGDSEGASAYALVAILTFDPVLTAPWGASQVPHQYRNGRRSFAAGLTPVDADGWAIVLNQVAGLVPQSTDPGNLTTGTAALIARAPGVVDVSFYVNPSDVGATLNYFGITHAPGIQFEILPALSSPAPPGAAPVPEPKGAVVIGAALLVAALASGRRR